MTYKGKKLGEWKIHLTMKVNLMLSKDNDHRRLIHSKSYNIEIMIDNDTDEIINEIFESLLSRYQIGLEESMNLVDLFLIMLMDCIINIIK